MRRREFITLLGVRIELDRLIQACCLFHRPHSERRRAFEAMKRTPTEAHTLAPFKIYGNDLRKIAKGRRMKKHSMIAIGISQVRYSATCSETHSPRM